MVGAQHKKSNRAFAPWRANSLLIGRMAAGGLNKRETREKERKRVYVQAYTLLCFPFLFFEQFLVLVCIKADGDHFISLFNERTFDAAGIFGK